MRDRNISPISNPPANCPETEPGLFWFWNATPTVREITDRIEACRNKGFRSLHIHPMPANFRPQHFHGGMELPYLSDAYFELIAEACEQMRRRDMWLWLYDEGGWPSGCAGGAVVRENPDFGIWGMTRHADRFTPEQYLDQVNFPDLMNRDATECFIRHTHERYRQYVEHAFGSTIRGIFTDEPTLLGRVGTNTIPWSPLITSAYEIDHQQPLTEVLEHLFTPANGDAHVHRVHRRYLHTMSRLISQSYYAPIRAWCDQHGLLFEGHPSGDNHFSSHGQFFGHYLEQARHYHIPGVDAIWRQVFPGTRANYVALAASSAWAQDKRIAMTESYNVYGAGLTLAQMRWIFDYQCVRGVNRLGIMASLHNNHGDRRVSTCSDISPTDPRWEDLELLLDHVRTTANFTTAAPANPTVGVFYRAELLPEDQAQAFDNVHERICDRVLDQLNTLMFVGCHELNTATLDNGIMHIGKCSLRALAVHVGDALDAEETAALQRVVEAGIPVVWIDNKTAWEQFQDYLTASPPSLTWVSSENELDMRFASTIELEQDIQGIRLLTAGHGATFRMLWFNESDHTQSFRFQCTRNKPNGLAEVNLNHPTTTSDSAATQPLQQEGRYYTLKLLPGETRGFVAANQTSETVWQTVWQQPLETGWSIAEQHRYVINHAIEIQANDAQPCLTNPTTLGDYAKQHADFSGALIYENRFTYDRTTEQEQRLTLDLGIVHESAEVTLNDQVIGKRAWAPYHYDLTPAIRQGINCLKVRVTNTLANQWLDLATRSSDQNNVTNSYLDRANEFVKDSIHAGLIGPVCISQQSLVDRSAK